MTLDPGLFQTACPKTKQDMKKLELKESNKLYSPIVPVFVLRGYVICAFFNDGHQLGMRDVSCVCSEGLSSWIHR